MAQSLVKAENFKETWVQLWSQNAKMASLIVCQKATDCENNMKMYNYRIFYNRDANKLT
jgi:hypothetical protein